ncbi:ABC transporter ATP-binding protein [Phenylobacterium sp.]|jgi:putative ABC transport system ATP-binding protein|uniref:ABC transporter ATP-binding protein n=1 Tax=Phenylobacterium sp. TaxID=1871053 RepID=UPI002E32FBE3|nr:ATP-binding cassette domain-containing protein [Phenylobacterium sp.]HEX4709357.1 ATP-binding cassette domain-containing protein [Phenylobacterium sp.]
MLLAEGLEAGRGDKPVARLRALKVEAGRAALLVGPSGVGKSTLLLALAGLAHTARGMARIGDADVLSLRGAALDRFRGRHIGFVFQDIHLLPGLSTLDNLLLSPFAAGVPQDRVRARALLEALGVGDKADRPAERLSRGEAQRAAIARAMLLKPRLILADEPTASLDDAAAQVVADLLLEAAAQTGAALVIATHDGRIKARIRNQVAVEAMA